jgi:formate dehydrogenase assembly factor FdhD
MWIFASTVRDQGRVNNPQRQQSAACATSFAQPASLVVTLLNLLTMTWKWHLRLAEKGKDATCFPTALASYAACAVKSGCRLCGQERANDVLSPVAQQQQHFAVEKLPDFSTLGGSPLEEALHDNTVSPVPDQVAFRLDFPAWLVTLSQRNRAMAEDMALGEKTQKLAEKYRVSEGRISQMRRYFEHDWSQFCGDSCNSNHDEA